MPSCWAIVVTGRTLGVQGMDGLVSRDPGGVALLLAPPPAAVARRASTGAALDTSG